MERRRVPHVIVPRYTTLGIGTFLFSAVDVSDFELGRFLVWRGNMIGANPRFEMHFEESSDLATRVACQGAPDPYEPAAQTDASVDVPFRRRHFRLRVDVGGTDALCTFCTYGYLLARRGVLT